MSQEGTRHYPLTRTATLSLLQALEHEPSKRLGQNFLIEGGIVEKSIRLAELDPGSVVLEIGPGLGTLTGTLIQAGHTVYAVDFDPTIARYLTVTFSESAGGRFHLMEGDAVRHPRSSLPADAPHTVIANLPYAITSPWLDAYLHSGPVLARRLVILVQKEAAQRLRAQTDEGRGGALTLFLQAVYRAGPLHPIAPHCFWPAPEVDSALMVWDLKKDPYFFSEAGKLIIRQVFTQRRKIVCSVMRKLFPHLAAASLLAGVLEETGLSTTLRAEAIPLSAWIAWDKKLSTQP
jgi:16S rRNA (adenine1518-N6/adenine1519-N6)-dimethyltransferase